MADVFDGIFGQPRVREFFRASIASGRVSHAYLFTGPAGSNKTAAAYAFAQALLCKNNGCRTCDDCKRIERRKHPDVHFYAPEGAQGYLIEQIREIISSVSLAPIRAQGKVYILDRVDLLGVKAANAFLKTLEEPVPGVTFILLGRTREGVLPTIVSRCQVVPFRHIPPSEAAGIVVQNTGCTLPEARIAIEASGGSLSKAAEFLRSSERGQFRGKVLRSLASLVRADDLDVLEYASEIVLASKAPLDAVRREQERVMEERAEFLQKSALRTLETRHKRALSNASLELLHQMTSVVRSWLRDVAAVCAGTPELILNVDVADAIRDAANYTSLERVWRAYECAEAADAAISYNVSPQTTIEAMLFEIREVLYAQRRPRKADL